MRGGSAYHLFGNTLLSKISKSVGVLFKLNSYLPPNILKMLYNSLILPYLNYGIESWYGAPRYSSDRVQVLQKKAIRAIHSLSFNHHTNEYFEDDKILKLNDIYKINLCSHMYNYITSPDTHILSSRFQTNSNYHNHNTRNRNNIVTQHFNRSSSQSCFLFQSTKEWNLIPVVIKSSNTLQTFKRKLKIH